MKQSKSVFNPLDCPSILDEPRRLTNITSWHEHIPFAFWIVAVLKPKTFVELGTHKGDSYGAFCQAVSQLGLPTRCYAVDTWKGDEHAGFYEEDVFTEFKAFHDQQYGQFSQLIRSTFDEALEHFSDGSIDPLPSASRRKYPVSENEPGTLDLTTQNTDRFGYTPAGALVDLFETL